MTNDQLQAHLISEGEIQRPTDYPYRPPCARIYCADGFNLSVQASNTAYSTPRDLKGPYTHVEIGFPSDAEQLLANWTEDNDNPTETVYPYTPIDVVLAIINKHGGVE